ncbi:hypothetical protein CSC2_20300 [Clostridium zeae]|uniref:Knr4/Smi1-like domain-containing protein n=1 Tax=Clostridium zeae TaxID=2759022 RepID=A0ABQ1E9N6_9CLOT|nr:SMI1/KNR4 family protein [Clostridium zeae]GFZ31504.1 hypothetical protein CSC2_20300 [Clostridium zeae]
MENYQNIIDKFKDTFLKSGLIKEDINILFGRAEDNELEYLIDLYKTLSTNSQFYNEDDLEDLKSIVIPKSIKTFYRENEPKNVPMLKSGVRLLSLRGIKEENSSGEPSLYLTKYGVIAIATTIGGNIICLDFNDISNDEPSVLIASNNFCAYNDELECIEIVDAPEDIIDEYEDDEPIELTYNNLKRCLPQIAKTFSEFMCKLAYDEYGNIEKEYL